MLKIYFVKKSFLIAFRVLSHIELPKNKKIFCLRFHKKKIEINLKERKISSLMCIHASVIKKYDSIIISHVDFISNIKQMTLAHTKHYIGLILYCKKLFSFHVIRCRTTLLNQRRQYEGKDTRGWRYCGKFCVRVWMSNIKLKKS